MTTYLAALDDLMSAISKKIDQLQAAKIATLDPALSVRERAEKTQGIEVFFDQKRELFNQNRGDLLMKLHTIETDVGMKSLRQYEDQSARAMGITALIRYRLNQWFRNMESTAKLPERWGFDYEEKTVKYAAEKLELRGFFTRLGLHPPTFSFPRPAKTKAEADKQKKGIAAKLEEIATQGKPITTEVLISQCAAAKVPPPPPLVAVVEDFGTLPGDILQVYKNLNKLIADQNQILAMGIGGKDSKAVQSPVSLVEIPPLLLGSPADSKQNANATLSATTATATTAGSSASPAASDVKGVPLSAAITALGSPAIHKTAAAQPASGAPVLAAAVAVVSPPKAKLG